MAYDQNMHPMILEDPLIHIQITLNGNVIKNAALNESQIQNITFKNVMFECQIFQAIAVLVNNHEVFLDQFISTWLSTDHLKIDIINDRDYFEFYCENNNVIAITIDDIIKMTTI